jgi:glycosyltransferase involved in cell wall biosynthesis
VACILRAPTDDGAKGVVVFTTPERDRFIREQRELADSVAGLKERWLVGLHHNWHDHAFVYDPLFDFSMAGEGDLVTVDGTEVPLVTLDACNFVPASFEPGGTKFWDVLYVARPVFFKGLPDFLTCMRALFDLGHRLRVLCVCPMPPEDPADADTVLYDLEDRYLELFSRDERRLFTLLTLRFDYPFPLDLPTLAHLYRSSRCFVHFARDERRCRVAGYAWAAGLPVVAMPPVGSLLPAELRRPPFFYEVTDYAAFPERILAALSDADSDSAQGVDMVRRHFAAEETTLELRSQLNALDPKAGLGGDAGWMLTDLDIRLGRHHGIAPGPNSVDMQVPILVSLLAERPEAVRMVAQDRDPETRLAESAQGTDGRVTARRRVLRLFGGWR